MVGSGIYDLETQTNRGLKKIDKNITHEFMVPVQSLSPGNYVLNTYLLWVSNLEELCGIHASCNLVR